MVSFPNDDEMPARFCYIVTNPELHYLEIQQDFVINHGHYVPNYVKLKVYSSDKLFEVKVVRLGCELFLMKGWETFKEYYSVKYGAFLTFEFDGDSTFDVFIFDRTCTHIECPFGEEETDSDSDSHIECPFGEEETDSDSDSDDGFETLPKSECKRSLATVARDEEERTRKRSISERKSLASVAREEEERTRERKRSKSEWKRCASVAPEEEERARTRKRSKTYTVLRKSAAFQKGKTSRMVNIAGDGSENNSDDDNRFNNNLEDGLCVGTSDTFTKIVKIHQAHKLALPSEFAKNTGISAYSKIILMDVKGSEQEVSIVGRASDRCAFGSGWYEFLRKNKIIVGSTLSFKFISSASKIIEVRVEKRATDKKKLFEYVKKRNGRYVTIQSCDHSRKTSGDHTKRSKGKDIVTNQEGGSRLRTKPVDLSNPQELGSKLIRSTGNTWAFSVKLKYHHYNKLDIPKKFVNGTGLARKNEILLKVGSDGEWPVRVLSYRRYTYSMTTGWRDFLRDNKLFEGNTITFKFVQDSDNWIDVRVSKEGEMGKPMFTLRRLGRPPGPLKSSANL